RRFHDTHAAIDPSQDLFLECNRYARGRHQRNDDAGAQPEQQMSPENYFPKRHGRTVTSMRQEGKIAMRLALLFEADRARLVTVARPARMPDGSVDAISDRTHA